MTHPPQAQLLTDNGDVLSSINYEVRVIAFFEWRRGTTAGAPQSLSIFDPGSTAAVGSDHEFTTPVVHACGS